MANAQGEAVPTPPGTLPGTDPTVMGGSKGPMDPNEKAIRDLLDKVGTQGLDSVNNQKRNVGEQEQMLKAYLGAMKPQTDMSSIAALVDSWYGGNLAKSMPKALSGQDIASTATNLQSAVQKARTGLSEADMQLLKDQLNSRLKLKELDDSRVEKLLKAEQINGQKLQNAVLKNEKMDYDQRNAFQKQYSPVFDSMNDMNRYALGIKSSLQGKSEIPLNDPTIKSNAANLIESFNQAKAKLGALTGSDKKMLEHGIMVSNEISSMLANRLMGIKPSDITRRMDEMVKVNDYFVDSLDKKQKVLSPRIQPMMDSFRAEYEGNKAMAGGEGSASSGPDLVTILNKPADQLTPQEIQILTKAHQKQVGAH